MSGVTKWLEHQGSDVPIAFASKLTSVADRRRLADRRVHAHWLQLLQSAPALREYTLRLLLSLATAHMHAGADALASVHRISRRGDALTWIMLGVIDRTGSALAPQYTSQELPRRAMLAAMVTR